MNRIFRITILTGILLLVAFPSQAQDLVMQERASALIEENRYSEAIVLLNAVITPTTRDARLFLLRAEAHEGRGDLPSAARDFEKALELNPGSVEARDGFRRVQQRQNGTAESGNSSLESLRRLVELNPDNLSYRIRLADALFEARRFREAAGQYGEYLERTQGTPDIVQSYLIAIAGYEGDNDLGEQVAKKYTKMYSNNDDLWMRLGYFHLWQSEYKQAQNACDQAVKLNPNNREAKECLGNAQDPGLASGGQSQYPIDVLFRELQADPTNDSKRFQLVDLLVDAGRYFEARQQLERLATPHRSTEAWQERWRLVENRIQTEPAGQGPSTFIVDVLQRRLEANPDNDEVRFQLVEAFLEYNRYFEAYDELVILEPRHGHEQRWLSLFMQADQGLLDVNGNSPIYPIDRYTYRLRFNPTDMQLRYNLVDELVAANRFAEAYDVLIDPRYSNPADPGYQGRFEAIERTRQAIARQKIDEYEAILAQDPRNEAALRGIIPNYNIVGRADDAIRTYVRLIELRPEDRSIRIEYVNALRLSGYAEQAVIQSRWLADRDPQNPEIQRLYVMSQIGAGQLDARGESFLVALLALHGNDPELLFEAASYRLATGNVVAAKDMTDRLEALNEQSYASRVETLRLLISREELRAEEQELVAILNEARRQVTARQYQAAIASYERYFEASGRRTRAELKEYAQVQASANNFDESVSIFKAILAESWDFPTAKELARIQMTREDYSGALGTLERLQAENPRDYEVRFMQAEALRQLGQYEQAQAIYDEARGLAKDSEYVNERVVGIDGDIRAAIAQSGEWTGYDFAGVIVPTSSATRSRGGGTRYDRWAQGMQTQVTLPINTVLTAGVNSHFISGTRRLVPNSEVVRGRVNQIFMGGYIDLTPPFLSKRASYSNRISTEFGLYDYEGARTVVYGGIRYWRQELGSYEASAGLRTGEGTIDLWSPGGAQFNLRLTQFDVKGSSVTVMPDSVLRLSGSMALNVVRDNFGNTASNSDTNFGSVIQLEAGYKIIDYTFLGITYYNQQYRSTVDTYFSPRNYQVYDFFLEYEKEMPQTWYIRVRGAMGMIAQSSGFISRRFEVDYIKRLGRNFSVTLSSSLGASTRTLGSGSTAFFDKYNTFTFSGALYWTL